MTTVGARRSTGVLVAALSLAALTVALLQTAVVPVLGIIAHQLDVSSVAVSWAVTANLLAAAAATPLIGRLADLHNKKHVLLIVLVIVLVGSVLAATTSSLPLLLVARVLQGVSFSLYPICVAILRDELPEEQVVRSLAVLSGHAGIRRRNGSGGHRPADDRHRRLPPRVLADHRFHAAGDRGGAGVRAVPRAHRWGGPSTGWARWAWQSA